MKNTHAIETQADSSHTPWWMLAVLLCGTLLPPLDFFIVNVALPSIQNELKVPGSVVQMVVAAYAATYAVLLITGGRLGDIWGRRRVFILALSGFTASSVLCGLAWSPLSLITGRVLQGATAAVMAPQALASIHALFPEEQKRKALALYGTTFGLASVIGQAFGGVLIALNLFGLGWRTIFLINIPVAAFAIPAALKFLPESRSGKRPNIDTGGMLLLASALTALIVPLTEGRNAGWPVWTFILLLMVPFLMIWFWRYEKHVFARGEMPLIIPFVFAAAGLKRMLLATFFFYSIAPFFLLFALYQQNALFREPVATGLAILPLGVGFFLGPLFGTKYMKWAGEYTVSSGMLLESVGIGCCGVLAALHLPQWLPLPLFLTGIGQGVALPSLVLRVVSQIDHRFAGLSSGLVNAVLQISGALFVAVIGSLFFLLAGGGDSAPLVTHAFVVSCTTIGVLLAIAAWTAWPVMKIH